MQNMIKSIPPVLSKPNHHLAFHSMRISWISLVLVSVVIVFGQLLFSPTLNAQNGKVMALPMSQTVNENQEFNVLYRVEPGSSPVSVIDFIIHFDVQYLECIAIEDVGSPLKLQQIEPKIDNETGKVLFGAFTLKNPPEELFSLLRIKFKALEPIDETSIDIITEGHPKTIMAFAGESTLHPGLNKSTIIQIHPEMNMDDMSSGEQFAVDFDEQNNIGLISYRPAIKDAFEIVLKDDKNQFVQQIHRGIAQPGFDYTFRIDFASIPFGRYSIELVDSKSSRTQHFMAH